MAERRMFAKTIVLSDAFLDMPLSARCLYFTLGMFADDDGFVNSPKGIMRQCGASEDDMKLLLAKKFLLDFESGVIVIKHWRINNYLRNDRYQETKYLEEKSELVIDENGAYKFGIPNSGIPSIGKVSIVKDSIDKDNSLKKTKAKESEPDFEEFWNFTFNRYPKKTSPAVAKHKWMDIIIATPEENQKEVAKLIWKATEAYLADYEAKNPNDKDYRYIPKYATWLTEDCDYWISQVEKGEKDG